MNSIKPLITIAVLGGIGYVVYVQLNSKPSTPPPGAPQNWESATVQMPGESGAAPSWGNPGSALPSVSIGGPGGGAAPPAAAPAYTPAPTFAGGSALPAPDFNAPPAEAGAYGTAAGGYGAAPGGTLPGGAAPDYQPGGQIPPAGASYPNEEKWGTTDPAAAVGNQPPVANYGDPAPPANYNDPAARANYGDPAAPAPNAQPPIGTTQPGGAIVENTYTAPDANIGQHFEAAMDAGQRMLEQGQLVEALRDLSTWHAHPQLSAMESQRLNDLLDQVAGTVIYSTQHLLEPAYVVKPGDRLETIGDQYQVPWQLLAKINGIDDPASLQPGEQLKVIRGPFSAVIQLDKRQLTLMLDGMYAGRFSIGVGNDMPPREGNFTVTEKVVDPVYHGRDRAIPADDPRNPLGERLIALGPEMSIHGMGPLTDITSSNQPGSISMGARDVEDVFDILSVGSKVLITR